MAAENHEPATNDTIKTLLAQAREQLSPTSGSPALDAEILLCHALKANRAYLFANPGQSISQDQALLFTELVSARKGGRPIAQLTGAKEFWSLNLKVSAEVLVPRPETELLVERALAHIPATSSLRILDLGTGSGAIAIAIATERTRVHITASDKSDEALRLANENAALHVPQRISFISGDWYAALDNQLFDVIVSNPPYIAITDSDLTSPELQFEPAAALYSGTDGLDDIRQIISGSPARLVAGGRLLLEHGYNQAEAVIKLMGDAGFRHMQSHADLAGITRVTEAQFE